MRLPSLALVTLTACACNPNITVEDGETGSASGSGGGGPNNRNLLANPSFEITEGTSVADWELVAGNNDDTAVGIDSTIAAEGTQSVHFTMPGSWEFWVVQQVSTADLTPGARMLVTGKIRVDRAAADISSTTIISWENERIYMSIDVPSEADTWTDFSGEFQVPDTNRAFLEFLVHIEGPMDQVLTTAHVDELSLTAAP